MALENWWLENEISCWDSLFSGASCWFSGRVTPNAQQKTQHGSFVVQKTSLKGMVCHRSMMGHLRRFRWFFVVQLLFFCSMFLFFHPPDKKPYHPCVVYFVGSPLPLTVKETPFPFKWMTWGDHKNWVTKWTPGFPPSSAQYFGIFTYLDCWILHGFSCTLRIQDPGTQWFRVNEPVARLFFLSSKWRQFWRSNDP